MDIEPCQALLFFLVSRTFSPTLSVFLQQKDLFKEDKMG